MNPIVFSVIKRENHLDTVEMQRCYKGIDLFYQLRDTIRKGNSVRGL